jgi:predicted transcriptional regulator
MKKPTQKPSVSSLKISDIMTAQPFSTTMADTVREVIESLIARKISGAPVLEKNSSKVISIVSEADLMRLAALGGLDQRLSDFSDRLVPTSQLVTVGPDDSFSEVFKRFLTKPVRRVLVVDSQMNLLGIVSRRDIIAAFLKMEKKP